MDRIDTLAADEKKSVKHHGVWRGGFSPFIDAVFLPCSLPLWSGDGNPHHPHADWVHV